jgi:hypothetical protein
MTMQAEHDPDSMGAALSTAPSSAARETDNALMARLGMDAEKWTVEFGTRFHFATVCLDPERPSKGWVDKADLIGWFANAIMAGYDRGREQGEKEARQTKPIPYDVEPLAFAPAGAKPAPEMSTCDKCGARYPSAPHGVIHKCQCSGGMMVRDNSSPLSHIRGDLKLADSEIPPSETWTGIKEMCERHTNDITRIATILIPRIDNDGHDLAAEHAALQVEMIGIFGGYTATAAVGAWRDGLAIYRDEVTKYEVRVKAFDTTVERDLQRIAARAARSCRQACIMLWLPDGTVICVDAEGSVR